MDTNRSRRIQKFKEKLESKEFGLKVDQLIHEEIRSVERQLDKMNCQTPEEIKEAEILLEKLHKLKCWDLDVAFELYESK